MRYKKIFCVFLAAVFLLTAASGAVAQQRSDSDSRGELLQRRVYSGNGNVVESKIDGKLMIETDEEIKIMGLSFDKIYPINQEKLKGEGRVYFEAEFPRLMSVRIFFICIYLQALPVKLTKIEYDVQEDSIIEGYVTDDEENPIPEAKIVVKKMVDSELNKVKETTTDEDGFYNLKIKSDTYVISASKQGYKEETKEVELKPEEKVEVNFVLTSVETVMLTLDTNPADLILELFSLHPDPIERIPTTDGKIHAIYYHETNVEVTAQEEYENYIFDHWSNAAEGDENPLDVLMNEDKEIIANYELEEENVPPVACFEHHPEEPMVNEELVLNASCSEDTDGEIESYSWEITLPDGCTMRLLEGEQVSIIPVTPGLHNVILTVVDNEGASDSISKDIEVQNTQEDINGTIKGLVTDNETGEPLSDVDIRVKKLLDFEDEEIYETKTNEEGWYDLELKPGFYLVSARKEGYKTSAEPVFVRPEETKEINFSLKKQSENQPPVANFSYNPENPIEGEPITLDARHSYDPDGRIVLYKWTVEKDGDQKSYATRLPFLLISEIPEAGVYTITLTVVDNNAAEDSITKDIEVQESEIL